MRRDCGPLVWKSVSQGQEDGGRPIRRTRYDGALEEITQRDERGRGWGAGSERSCRGVGPPVGRPRRSGRRHACSVVDRRTSVVTVAPGALAKAGARKSAQIPDGGRPRRGPRVNGLEIGAREGRKFQEVGRGRSGSRGRTGLRSSQVPSGRGAEVGV